MARIVLITGGCRSGKSAHAQRMAESLDGARVFVATCPVTDDEMRARIARHRQQRRHRDWDTIEEQVDLAAAIGHSRSYGVVLVDCLTLWVNNLMYETGKRDRTVDEHEIERLCGEVLDACRGHGGTVIFVTNEVGMGIVPDNAASRRYRDLVGRCNQVVAAGADEVTLVACGIPSTLKKRNHDAVT